MFSAFPVSKKLGKGFGKCKTKTHRISGGEFEDEEDFAKSFKQFSEKGKAENVIEKQVREGKTFFVINDYNKLRTLFGQLLREIQRIKSEGDFNAGKNLIENYGVKADQVMLKEVHDRYAKLNIAPYMGFIQPKLVAVMDGDNVKEVKVEYPTTFLEQMLDFGKTYSFLPVVN